MKQTIFFLHGPQHSGLTTFVNDLRFGPLLLVPDYVVKDNQPKMPWQTAQEVMAYFKQFNQEVIIFTSEKSFDETFAFMNRQEQWDFKEHYQIIDLSVDVKHVRHIRVPSGLHIDIPGYVRIGVKYRQRMRRHLVEVLQPYLQ